MKKVSLIVSIFIGTLSVTAAQAASKSIGLANPASEFCAEQGGNLVPQNTPEGQQTFCVLPDGTSCDEWVFFRAKGKCPANTAQ